MMVMPSSLTGVLTLDVSQTNNMSFIPLQLPVHRYPVPVSTVLITAAGNRA